jgi:hypothetical protein
MKGLVKFLPSAGLALLIAGLGTLSAAEAPKPKGKAIDVVICLDTSNSMDGLIDSAKARLWDIVNDLARVKPTPNLRVGLYSYGNDTYDPKVGWVRKEADLTTDLDLISQKLFALRTLGGTEYVTRVCRDALQQQQWSADKDALKLIFVCGNEPASQDPLVKLGDAATLARRTGVVINPIFCGPANHPDASDWKEYAQLCGGKFTNINQARGAVVIATPMDKELGELSGQLNTTYVAYGKDRAEKAANQAAQDANAGKLGAGAAASRAVFKAGGLYRNAEWDLVERLKNDPKFDVRKVPEGELCDELRKMKPAEREKHVKDMLARREAIQKRIGELSGKRVEYIREQQRKNADRSDRVLDDAIRGAIREQAATKGIKIPG